MKKLLYACSAVVLASCATTSDESSMSPEQLAECLQPNRRVVVEVVGLVVKPPAKKPEAKPQEAKPEAAKPEADKPAADKPAPKPKVEMAPFEQSAYVQGNDAFDRSSATLKPGGQKELDQLLALIKKRAVQVNAVIVAGHTDRLEAKSAPKSLSEDRAKAVKYYLVSRGITEKIIFWEGKEATQPVAVTKFCN
jgi:outer membrane protein OmpA-like peptidoglycan-associated protein